MIQKKICLLGAFSVGKTSLIKRFITSIFNDEYHTTIGVKIDKKLLHINKQAINLMIWDLAGQDDYNIINDRYLRGMSGCIIVLDNTRESTYPVALSLYQRSISLYPKIPIIFVINKSDLPNNWPDYSKKIESLKQFKLPIIHTSAKNGYNVEIMFHTLTKNILKQHFINIQ